MNIIKSNQSKTITVAIPFYNASQFISQAIESVINQTYANWILLLINDGSTDNSIDIANKYKNIDSRIHIINDGLNKGLASRLNEIAHLCETKYLARMDADDIMHPNKLEKQFYIMENNEIDVLGTNAYSIDENNDVMGIRFPQKKEIISSVNDFIHPTIIAKKSWFIKNPYNEKAIRIEDKELWFRTHSKNNFKVINEPLFFYREINGEYYKKYYKTTSTLFYLNKLYYFDYFWIKKIISNFICIPTYWFFEKILKNNYLIKRRNKIKFQNKKNINNYL